MSLASLKKQLNEKRPSFLRQDYHKKKRLALVWRRPKGVDSKLRKNLKGHGFIVQAGYRSPVELRGLLGSGLMSVVVHNPEMLQNLDNTKHIIIMGGTMGLRSRIELAKIAESKGFKIANKTSFQEKLAKKEKHRQELKQRRKTTTETKEKKPQPSTPEEKKEAEKIEKEKVLTQRER